MKKIINAIACGLALTIVGCSAKEPTKSLKPVKDIEVVIHTDAGDITATIFASRTPVTAASFLNLAKRGYYNGTTFHRVIQGFVSQAGKHVSGEATPGYKINNETYTENPALADLKHNLPGMLSMARTAIKHTNGSQFYITHAPVAHLDGQYTVFGKVTKGLNVAVQLTRGTKVSSIEVKGDTANLFANQAKLIATWNKTLDSKFFNLKPIEKEKAKK